MLLKKQWISLGPATLAGLSLAQMAPPLAYPGYQECDYTVRNFRFHTGGLMPALKLYCGIF